VSKVIQATYCVFDIVSRRDVWVEVTLPGTTNVYAIS